MSTLLVKNSDVLVTMDEQRRELKGADLFARDGVIVEVGQRLFHDADEIIDATNCVVTPGLINTHHHLFQSLVRVVPKGQDALLFGWLQTLYPIFARMGPEEIYASAQLGLAELALSGCTLSSDHLYMFPNGARLEDTIEAASSIGIRFHPTRGSMSIGESKGGLPPDSLTENEDEILEDCIRVVDGFHDPSDGAMVRVGLAPCSPFSVSTDLMRETALLARDKGVMLHTHLAENEEDIRYSLEHFGCRPGEYAEQLGWLGDDVWHAHCVKLDASEIDLFARTQTGVAHCPCSNCRLGSGIAPVRAMLDAGVNVALGVDGSASNDSGHLLLEARQSLLLQRVQNGADAMSARESLALATCHGAKVLGRSDLGVLAPGKRADLAIWPMDGIAASGTWDPVAALILSGPFMAKHVFVEGRAIVRDGMLANTDLEQIIRSNNRLAKSLAEGAL